VREAGDLIQRESLPLRLRIVAALVAPIVAALTAMSPAAAAHSGPTDHFDGVPCVGFYGVGPCIVRIIREEWLP
jgi:hypothetical protein